MLDQYGRIIDYMRISVTDRCNLSCRYCMPEKGMEPLAGEAILSYEEILRLCRLFAQLGIKKIKLTGGEPLVRPGICQLLREIKQISGIEQVTMTTNGILLAAMAKELVASGLDAINISLDTLNDEKFTQITRWGSLPQVLKGIKELQNLGYRKIKINCVPILGINEDEIAHIAKLAKDDPVSVRFIELMPIGNAVTYTAMKIKAVKEILEKAYGGLCSHEQQLGNGPAEYFSLPDFSGKIGFIDAIDHKFCDNCNRVRLTANGFLKLCLQYNSGVDLKQMLRSNADDVYLRRVIKKYMYLKPQEHCFYGKNASDQWDDRKMFQVGG